MRIALVAPFGLRPKGTTSARALPIGKVLAASGAAVRLIVPPWDDPGRAGERRTEDGVEIIHTRLGPRPLTRAVVIWDVLQEIRTFRPDVVHAFKPIGYSGAIASRLAGRARPLLVVDTDDLEGPAGWAGRRGLGLAGRLRGAQERRTLRSAPYVTVASAWLADFVGGLGVAADRVLRLPNGHSITGAAEPRAPSAAARRATPGAERGTSNSQLLWYTRFTEAEPWRAARLLARLLRGHAELRLTVLGDELGAGDRSLLYAALASEGVAAQVSWLGYEQAGGDQLVAGLAPTAIAVYPMEDDPVNRARSPSKIPQLMALGIPIVAEAVGEIATYLQGFEGECLAAPGDADGFRERVAALLRSRQKRTRLARRLERGAEQWRWDRVAGGLLAWYEERLPAG